jgi:hypothetical protein
MDEDNTMMSSAGDGDFTLYDKIRRSSDDSATVSTHEEEFSDAPLWAVDDQ